MICKTAGHRWSFVLQGDTVREYSGSRRFKKKASRENVRNLWCRMRFGVNSIASAGPSEHAVSPRSSALRAEPSTV